MSLLEMNNVVKRYGSDMVLDGLDLRVDEGDFISIVGASGAGKTTFLKLLLGTESPTSGAITLDGTPLRGEPDPDRGIVFQRYSVFPHLRVLDNLVVGGEFQASPLAGRLFGARRRSLEARAREVLEEVGLGASERRFPHELSGGMQQRLALAQALMGAPRLLLLDEPFGALDPGIRLDMQRLVTRLWREHNLTVFMVTHDIAEGFRLGTRLLAFDRPDPAKGCLITFDLPLHAPEHDHEPAKQHA